MAPQSHWGLKDVQAEARSRAGARGPRHRQGAGSKEHEGRQPDTPGSRAPSDPKARARAGF